MLTILFQINFEGGENPFGTPNPLAYISKEKYLVSQKLLENKQVIQFELITPFDLQSLETANRGIYGRYCYWQYRGMGCSYQGDLICQESDVNFSVVPEKIKSSPTKFTQGSFEENLKYYVWKDNFEYKVGNVVFVNNLDLNGFKDPPRTWFVCIKDHTSSRFFTPNRSADLWERDGCSKTLEACKKRFKYDLSLTIKGSTYVPNNDASIFNNILPFGGFPGTDKFKYE
jgi:phage-related protein